MLRYLALRLAVLAASLVLASLVVFVILRLLPGDSAGTTLGVGATAEQLETLRNPSQRHGLPVGLSQLRRQPAHSGRSPGPRRRW